MHVEPGELASVYRCPGLDATVVARLRNGTEVSVKCTVEGDLAWSAATDSMSTVWDRIPQGYIPHVDLDTVNQRQVGSC